MSASREAIGRWSGIGTVVSGTALVLTGLWARREVRKTLGRERIVSPAEAKPVRCGNAARSLAEVIRRTTVEAAGGRTYAETALYVDPDGKPTRIGIGLYATSARTSPSRTPSRRSGCSRRRSRLR